MRGTCEACEHSLEPDWVACPYCGRPSSGKVGTEKLVRMLTKVGIEMLEVGLMEAEANATEKGNTARAAQIAVARNLAREIAPKLADVVTTYAYQKRVLSGEDAPRKLPAPKSHTSN